jgi:hypothetical protein
MDINTRGASKMIKALEESPHVRWLLWGVLLTALAWRLPDVLVALK